MKMSFFLNGFVLILCFIFVGCSNNPEKDWLKAKSKNTIEAYAEFLEKHPESPHKDTISLLIKRLSFVQEARENSTDSLSWLKTNKYDKDLSEISEDSEVEYEIPHDEPLDSKGTGKIDTYGNFTPIDKKSYQITGGALVSTLGTIKKKAKFKDWDFVYEDTTRTKKGGWGPLLVHGEMIVPKSLFSSQLSYVSQNSFEAESFGEKYVLIRLDSTKGHRLCFWELPDGSRFATVGIIGTKVEVGGNIVERKADGWYLGTDKLRQ